MNVEGAAGCSYPAHSYRAMLPSSAKGNAQVADRTLEAFSNNRQGFCKCSSCFLKHHSLQMTSFFAVHKFYPKPWIFITAFPLTSTSEDSVGPPSSCKWMKQMMCFSKKVKITFFFVPGLHIQQISFRKRRAKVLLSCKKYSEWSQHSTQNAE